MPRAKVNYAEIDLSASIPGFDGVKVAAVIPTNIGPLERTQVGSVSELLKFYSLNDKVEINYDLSYFTLISVLSRARLILKRATPEDITYSGRNIFSATTEAFTETLADASVAINTTTDVITVVNNWPTGSPVKLSTTGTLPVATPTLSATSTYFVINDSATEIRLATSLENALADTAIVFTSADTSDLTLTFLDWAEGEMDPENHDFTLDANAVFGLYSSNPGEWGNRVSYTLVVPRTDETVNTNTGVSGNNLTVTQNWATGEAVRVNLVSGDLPTGLTDDTVYFTINKSATTVALATTLANATAGTEITLTQATSGSMTLEPVYNVKEPDAFEVTIYVDGNEKETFIASMDPEHIDGYGANIYIENVMLQSRYVRAKDNLLVADTVMPQAVPVQTYLVGGDDGTAISDGDMIRALQSFSNPEIVEFTLLLDSAWTTVAYQQACVAIAESRMDCVAFLSTRYVDEVAFNYLNLIKKYKNETLNPNTSWAAMYTPHLKSYDTYNDRFVYQSPVGPVAAAVAQTAASQEIWFPTAGNKRGILNFSGVSRVFENSDADLLDEINVNPILEVQGEGHKIWGNKTLLSRPSALQSLHIRFLLVYIAPAIRKFLKDFLFDLHNNVTYAIVQTSIEQYMADIRERQGVYEFEVRCDSTNNTAVDRDKNQLNVDLFLKPTNYVKTINFRAVILNNTLTFELAKQAV